MVFFFDVAFSNLRGFEQVRDFIASSTVTALIDQFYAEVQAMGGGRQDTSALVRRLPRKGKA